MTRRSGHAVVVGFAAVVTLALVAACSSPARDVPAGAGLDLAGMDRAIAPGDDFFAFANGAWVMRTTIPADRDGWGTGSALAELTEKRVYDLVSAAAKGESPAGSDVRKIGDYFNAFMDSTAIEKADLSPIRAELDRIAAIGDRTALARFLGGTLRADVDLLNNTDEYTPNILGVWIAQDLEDPAHYIPFLVQGGLGMPDREYYLDDSARMNETRAKYRSHVAKMLTLARIAGPGSSADAQAARIVELERKIAEVHWTREDTGSVKKGDNHWSRADFSAKAHGLDWDAFFEAAGLGARKAFIVWQPSAVAGISTLVARQPIEVWKEYLAFHAVEARAPYLPAALDREHFAFHGGVVNGIPQQRERWKRALEALDAALGEAVGKLYVERWFPPSEKARAEAMVGHLLDAFRRRIDRITWMAPETKEHAKAKLAVLKVGVGYPDRWRDYSGLTVARDDAFGNTQRAELFEYRRKLAQLDQPVDRSEWVMTPQTVDAVNLPSMNAMNFPAAILQPPFFDPTRPEAMDYGDMGATIGHEVSHSFDDQGALFDAEGRLRNWWTASDLAHFTASGARLAEQYSAYRPFPDAHVNGQQTLAENLADLAGLAAAYDAYLEILGDKPAPVVAGFSGDQQFFLSYAQSWRTKRREAAVRRRLITDGHAPPEYRADTVRNLDTWYAAFGVKPRQRLYLAPEQRVRIW